MMGIAKREPFNVNKKASCPLPSKSNWCPGKIDKKLSSSGAPRKIDGIKSIKVWVMDIATINEAREIEGKDWNLSKERTRNAETRLMWIPGAKPVRVPARQPRIMARVISIITERGDWSSLYFYLSVLINFSIYFYFWHIAYFFKLGFICKK